MNKPKKIRVLVADDFAVIRRVIHLILEKTVDIEAVEDAPHLQDALDAIEMLQPDVIVMNDYLPPTTSAVATKMFRELGITAAVLIISMMIEPPLIHQSFACGANGFMHKDEMETLLAVAIRDVYYKERYLSPMVKHALAQDTR